MQGNLRKFQVTSTLTAPRGSADSMWQRYLSQSQYLCFPKHRMSITSCLGDNFRSFWVMALNNIYQVMRQFFPFPFWFNFSYYSKENVSFWCCNGLTWVSLVAQLVKNLPAMQEILVQFLSQEDPLEKE